ncbi:MAG: PQQ-binding-like beta-propeller repeat protein [Phycisphaeraceae bacterium]
MRKLAFFSSCLVVACAFASASAAPGDNWPQFRGPSGQGYSSEKNLPLLWGGPDNKNVFWKSPLKGEGHASPIVWGDRIFVCTVFWHDDVKDRKEVIPDHYITCYSAKDGSQLWQKQVKSGPWKRNDFRSGPGGGYAGPTPCTDGKHVYVVFGSSVIAALDYEGNEVWRKEIVPYTFDVTIGTSPLLYKDTLLFACLMAKKQDSKLIAYDTRTGEVKWQTPLPETGFGHSTPLMIEVSGKPQLLVAAGAMGEGGAAMQSLDPSNGKRSWWCKGGGEASSPVFADGIVYFDSGRGGKGTAVSPAGAGDVSASHIKWTTGNLGEAIGSPIIVGDHVYRLVSGGVLRCWSTKTGEEAYSTRVKTSSTWISPIADANGRIYFASAGKSFVVQAGAEFKLLAENDLGDSNHASPAVVDGKLILVGTKHIWCIGEK